MNDSLNTHSYSLSSQDRDNQIKTKLLHNWLETENIKFSEELSPPSICLYLKNTPICSLGNISLITGKAKSKKTFFVGLAVSAVLSNKTFMRIFKGNLSDTQFKILYFDTEQSNYHVQKSAHRICNLIEISNPNNLIVYPLRKYSPDERLERINYAINNTPDLVFVIIDGIRDLLTSINDENQSTKIISNLLKWSEEKNIHIMNVLHQNKGDKNARGHIGTELINKAETVLSITKDTANNDISIVEAQQCREKEPEPFAFEIDENGLPRIIEEWEPKSKKSKVNELTDDQNFKIIKEVFKTTDSLKYKDLVSQIRKVHEEFIKHPIGENKAKELMSLYKTKGWIVQDNMREPYKLGKIK